MAGKYTIFAASVLLMFRYLGVSRKHSITIASFVTRHGISSTVKN